MTATVFTVRSGIACDSYEFTMSSGLGLTATEFKVRFRFGCESYYIYIVE